MKKVENNYKIIEKYKHHKTAFENEIIKYLDDGWKCQGGVCFYENYYFQAMVRTIIHS